MKLQVKRLISQFFFLLTANLGFLNVKTGFCYPFFYCHACPTADAACPLRSLEISVFKGNFNWKLFFYPLVILGVVGVVSGRAVCGWACPIGFLQRGTGTVAKKIQKFPLISRLGKHKIEPYLRYVKYFILIGLIIITPILIGFMFTDICPIGFLTGKRIEMAAYLTSRVPGKHGRGGQSQRRFERLIEIAAHEWFGKAGEKASELFLEKKGLKGVIVGGPGPTKREFLNGDYLDYRIQEKIIGIYDTGYTDDYGLKEVINNASDDLEEMDLIKEKRVMNNFFEELRNDKGLAVYGEKEVRRALEMGAVDTLILSDALRQYRVKVHCTSCNYTGEMVVEDIEHITCPQCATPVVVKEKHDIIEEYTEMAEQTSTKLEIISRDTEEGETLVKGFGGVAGILRYRIE